MVGSKGREWMRKVVTAQKVVDIAGKYVGAKQYGSVHKGLIDRYNQVLPRPSGYKMTYDDAWCDAFVTAVADEAGANHLIGRECGVERHVKVCRDLGIWLGRVKPVVGDLVMFDWDGGGFADHIAYVGEVSGERFRTIEGNSNGRVERNWFAWNDWRVKGFARPQYGRVAGGVLGEGGSDNVGKSSVNELASQVLLGTWGNNPDRTRALLAAGYDALAVQAKVNQLMNGKLPNSGPGVKRVQVSDKASLFFTGEVMDAWVKGSRFDVLDQKSVNGGTIYLLGYKGGLIGWVKASDVKPL